MALLVRRHPRPAPPARVERLTRSIGAVVDGRSLPHDPSAAATILRPLVHAHQVVFVRGATLDGWGFTRLALAFGQMSVHPLDALLGRDTTITVIEDSAARPPAGFPWHSDLSWLDRPPRYGFLQALTIPPVGGDTLWAALDAVHAGLGVDDRSGLDRLSVRYRIDDAFAATVARNHGPDVVARLRAAHRPVERPLVGSRADGRPFVALSPLYQDALVAPPGEPAPPPGLLARLTAALDDPHVSVRWRWQPGDVAIWDESCTVHRALTDHHPARRRMRRCTVDAPDRVGP